MKKPFLNLILWTWCLPQTLLGLTLHLFFQISNLIIKTKPHQETLLVILNLKNFGGISLGKYILINKRIYNRTTLKHEYGHTIQNYLLGPLYLLIVGLPSITFSLLSRFSKKFAKNYYQRFPENWADRLGKVKR